MAIVSVTACRQSDPWRMVETAFEGVVTAISPEGTPHVAGGADTFHWITFEVSEWYTTDYGTVFSMWAPNFDGTIGESWLIAGALYYTLNQQSGEVFPCAATPANDSARAVWRGRLGSPVPAGSGTPEAAPDPAIVAQIEEQRAIWETAAIADYTAVISSYQRTEQTSNECGASGAQIRVTVEDGVATKAIDVGRLCTLDDPSTVLLIDDLFDLALVNAGAISDPIEFDPDLGYIRSFSASDRSVETSAYVGMLQPRVIEAVFGTDEVREATATAMVTWDEAGIDNYTYQLDVICFCITISGRFQVTVENGEVVEVSSDTSPVDLESPDNFMTYDIEGLFKLMGQWGGQSPDAMLASFDLELGYPMEVRIDSMLNADDDELTFFVSDFQASG